jgi:hypothetical protein
VLLMSATDRPDTQRKSLDVNLDPLRYGTFAEIGAGQEVVRWFFQAGGAAGTIAKSISAYDMQVSDQIYGGNQRYVSRPRLESMLEHEHRLNLERLGESRGESTAFFAFADTVSARNYHGTNDCHAWMGVRFQASPGAGDSQVVIHARMLDATNALQQEAIGILGVNLVYGAFFLSQDPDVLLASLLDGLSTKRIEVDMIEFSGADFQQVDGRVMSLNLVRLGLSKAAMFSPSGEVLQPSEVLYKKPVLVQRGSFRPVTYVNVDMQSCAWRHFSEDPDVKDLDAISILEITLKNLLAEGELDLSDFLDRVDLLAAADIFVLISDYSEYHRLAAYLASHTKKKIGLALGAGTLNDLFDERYYQELDGGILEAFGRLFKHNVKLYVYPRLLPESDSLLTVETFDPGPKLGKLFDYLIGNGCMQSIEGFERQYLSIFSSQVLAKIRAGDPSWETMVPERVAETVKQRSLFGYRET